VATPPDLGSRTWVDLDRHPAPLVVLPVGACEQHGPHLPLDTDTRIAVELAHRLAAVRPDVVVAPALSITASGEHSDFPGTLSLGTHVLTTVLVEVVRSATWAAGVVVVNGHGGNADALVQAEAVWRVEHRPVLAWSPTGPADGDAHAGRVETSVMLALWPGLVGDERPTGRTEPLGVLWPSLRQQGVQAVSPTGVLGDAAHASATEGDELLTTWAHDLVQAVERRWPSGEP
jgi:mycofactocin precursor peptide peptidase